MVSIPSLSNLPGPLSGGGPLQTIRALANSLTSSLFRNGPSLPTHLGAIPPPFTGTAGPTHSPGPPAWAGTPGGPGHASGGPPPWAGSPGGPGQSGSASPGLGGGLPTSLGGAVGTVANQTSMAIAGLINSVAGNTPAAMAMTAAAPFLAGAGQALGTSSVPSSLAQAFVAGLNQALRAGPAAHPIPAQAAPQAGQVATVPTLANALAPSAAQAAGQPGPAQTLAGTAQPATMVPTLPSLPQAALPARAEAAMAERATMAGTMAAPANAAPAGSTAAANTTAAQPAAAPGNAQVANPAAAPPPGATLAQAPATDARGNPLLAGNPAHVRPDGVATPHGHTAERGVRRSLGQALGDESRRGFATAMALMGLYKPANADEEAAIRAQAERVFQHLYWLLTIIAYVCAGLMLVVIAVPMFAGSPSTTLHAPGTATAPAWDWIAMLASVGAMTGLGAWWLARKRTAPPS